MKVNTLINNNNENMQFEVSDCLTVEMSYVYLKWCCDWFTYRSGIAYVFTNDRIDL